MSAVYNENDEFAAEWLRNLIKAGHIAPGDVDTRSIVDVGDDDYRGYTQVHLFAGIGGWSLAARLAGWPDDRPLWTGSCPCQPFSAAGKRKGAADARHLWPEMRRLLAARRPDVVAGEQVASKDGRIWLAGVRADLETMAYASWSVDACSAGVGAPHIRQRIWWLADTNGQGQSGQPVDGEVVGFGRVGAGGLADADSWQRDGIAGGEGRQPDRQATGREQGDGIVERGGLSLRLGDADSGFGEQRRSYDRGRHSGSDAIERPRLGGDGVSLRLGEPGEPRLEGGDARTLGQQCEAAERAGPLPGFWSDYDIVHCTDGKARRTGPGIFPLAHGVSGRVGRLRAYGNAINPWLAAQVLAAYLDGPNV